MDRYFIISEKRLVKGISKDDTQLLVDEAYEFFKGLWKKIDVNDVNDRLLGFDPNDDSSYGFGNTSIMDTIRKVTYEEVKDRIEFYKGVDLIQEYKKDSGSFLPFVDHIYKVFPSRNEFGDRNIGWNAGLIDDNRPFFAEAWATDGLTMITVFVSADGIEQATNEELIELVENSGYCKIIEGAPRPQIARFIDTNKNKFYSINIVVGLGENIWIKGGPVISFDVLNEINGEDFSGEE